jgi:hypothetical protein
MRVLALVPGGMIFAPVIKQTVLRWSSTSPTSARRKEMNAMAQSQTQALRLCDVMQAVSDVAANDDETLSTIVHLITSGQVRLSDDAIKAIRELSAPTNAAA